MKRIKAFNDAKFIVDKYLNNPVDYARDVLQIERLESWQEEVLKSFESNNRIAVASGHGIGKTFLISVIVHWFISTRPNPQIVVTANTGTQLETKTWRELSIINDRALNKSWFTKTATRFFLNDAKETWFASPISWNEQKPEAFAGTHSEHVLYVFDEASAIPNIIWEVSEGAMTTHGAKWVAFGNPTKNIGRFRECFRKYRHRWHTLKVDSRDVSISDKKQIKDWIEDYGEDSDFVKVRVKGEFPRAGFTQLIDGEDVESCKKYITYGYESMPILFGIDLARFGDDSNRVFMRQGRKVNQLGVWTGLDGMQTASRIVELYEQHNPELMFIDGDGLGGPIVDRVRQLVGYDKVVDVNNGRKADDPSRFFNKRTENWFRVKEAIKEGLDFSECDDELFSDLTCVQYGFDKINRLQLEKKEDIKNREGRSPNSGDALAMSFSKKVLIERQEDRRLRRRAVAGWRC